jgi:hypothetical protein
MPILSSPCRSVGTCTYRTRLKEQRLCSTKAEPLSPIKPIFKPLHPRLPVSNLASSRDVPHLLGCSIFQLHASLAWDLCVAQNAYNYTRRAMNFHKEHGHLLYHTWQHERVSWREFVLCRGRISNLWHWHLAGGV